MFVIILMNLNHVWAMSIKSINVNGANTLTEVTIRRKTRKVKSAFVEDGELPQKRNAPNMFNAVSQMFTMTPAQTMDTIHDIKEKLTSGQLLCNDERQIWINARLILRRRERDIDYCSQFSENGRTALCYYAISQREDCGFCIWKSILNDSVSSVTTGTDCVRRGIRKARKSMNSVRTLKVSLASNDIINTSMRPIYFVELRSSMSLACRRAIVAGLCTAYCCSASSARTPFCLADIACY